MCEDKVINFKSTNKCKYIAEFTETFRLVCFFFSFYHTGF